MTLLKKPWGRSNSCTDMEPETHPALYAVMSTEDSVFGLNTNLKGTTSSEKQTEKYFKKNRINLHAMAALQPSFHSVGNVKSVFKYPYAGAPH